MSTGKNKFCEITLYFFYRVNNQDCHITRGVLYGILDKYIHKIKMKEINFDQHKEICTAYKIYGVPTLLIVKNDEILNRYSGILESGEIVILLETLIDGK